MRGIWGSGKFLVPTSLGGFILAGRIHSAPFLQPGDQGLVGNSVEFGKLRTAQPTGLIGLDEGLLVLGSITQPTWGCPSDR